MSSPAAGRGPSPEGSAEPLSLSPSSYLVLGLIARHGPMTPYALKIRSGESVGPFWSFPHAQLYSEPDRLARGGLLSEEREPGGRRRRTFHLRPAGRRVLDEWLGDPGTEPAQLRDPALLKLSFADLGDEEGVRRLAERQGEAHRARLADYRRRAEELTDTPEDTARRRVLTIAVCIEEAHLAFWRSLLD
ncbi:PadR family transcriptional regulator [Streptomyces sp. NBC_01803]|uniref:PadR family transcriptional regulator n=1 Tax=Streptomyces sp. NBC_01803 TaxID=2975946 RepID=UPI002DDBF49F|nr:helix-turn-helix transcriptional regulator [Streptomyces sp. NBC_01803]WSA45024.1 PadR family transcriptional regulator [Streptomyces sp. NBC_01803]